jgi:hypothetical protein
MTLDDALSVYLIYLFSISFPEDYEKNLELCLLFWVFSNSSGFEFMEEETEEYNLIIDSENGNLGFSQFVLEEIKFKKIFPNLCEYFFFLFSTRIEGIDTEEILNFISEFNKFLMYESLLNYILEPFYEY